MMLIIVIVIGLFTLIIVPIVENALPHFRSSGCVVLNYRKRHYYKFLLLFLGFNSFTCNSLLAQNHTESQIRWFDAAYYRISFPRTIDYSVRDSSVIRTTFLMGPQDSLFFLNRPGIVTRENGLVVEQLDTVNSTVRSIQHFTAGDSFKTSSALFSPNGQFRLSGTSDYKDPKHPKLTVFHFDVKVLEIEIISTRFFNSYHELIANDGTVRLMLLPTAFCSIKVGNNDSIQIPPERATYLCIAPSGKIIMSDIPIVSNQSVVDMWQSVNGGVRILLIDRDTGFYRPEMNLHKRIYELLRLDNDRVVTWRTKFVSAGAVLAESGALDPNGRLVIMFNVGSPFEQGLLRFDATHEYKSLVPDQLELVVCIDEKGEFKWWHKMETTDKRFIRTKMLIDTVGNRLLIACSIVDSSEIIHNAFGPVSIMEAGENSGVGVVTIDFDSGEMQWRILEKSCSITSVIYFNAPTSGTYFLAAEFKKLPPRLQTFSKINIRYSKLLVGTFNLK